MTALHVTCKTARFSLSNVGENFINPCCFAEDFADWLRIKLAERNAQVRQPYQEDCGWELPAIDGNDSYYLCRSGNADDSRKNENEGEWNIIIEKKRSIGRQLTGRGRIAANDKIVPTLEEILCADPTIRDVHRTK
jgi:hypothetical protein